VEQESRREPLPGSPATARALPALLGSLLAALVVWFYQPTLGLYFGGEDFVFLDRARITSWRELPDLFSVERNQLGLLDRQHAYRPLSTNLYFAALQGLFGPSPRAFHLANLALLLSSAVLLQRLARRLGLRAATSAGLAFLYATCSVCSDSQLWLALVQELALANAVLLAALLALPAAADAGSPRRRAGALLAFGAALLCKETALALVAIAFAGELLLGRQAALAAARRTLPLVGVAAAYLAWRLTAIGLPAAGPYSLEVGWFLAPSLARYLEWSLESLFLATGPLPRTLLFLAGAGLLGLASPPRRRLCLFGALWFLLALGPVLLLPAHAYPFYLMLPAAGLLLATGALVDAAADRIAAPRSLAAAGAAALALFAGSSHAGLLQRVEVQAQRGDAIRNLLEEIQRRFPKVATGTRFYFLLPEGFPPDALLRHSGAALRVTTGDASLEGYWLGTAGAAGAQPLRRGPGIVLEMGERGELRVLHEPPARAPERSPAQPPVILVTLDTTRVDRLDAYRYSGRTSPNLDRFARGALVFDAAYTTSSWTLPAHASLFTGKLVSAHGARKDPKGPLSLATAVRDPGRWKHYRARGLAEGETTLAEILRAHGWATGAVVAGPWMKRIFGLAQGFDSYDDAGIDHVNGRRAADVTTSALAFVESHQHEPFFLFVNYYDPHYPFDPPLPFVPDLPGGEEPRSLRRLSQLYDAEIRYMDTELGRLFDELARRGLYEDAWILVTADHGEVLGEAGRMGHGDTLMEVEIRVPLLVKYPAGQGPIGRSSEQVLITDVLPTLLGRLGIPVPAGLQGEPFPGVRHPIIAEVYPLPRVSPGGDWRVIIEGDFKYIWNSQGRSWLANLAEDPGETRDFSGAHPELARRLRETLLSTLESLPPPAPAGPEREVDPETQRALESLGYLD